MSPDSKRQRGESNSAPRATETYSIEDLPERSRDGDIPLDVVYDILRNERRRIVISLLQRSESELTIGELAEHIAAIENDKSISSLRSKERKRVYISLYQSHLPKMDQADVITYDSDRGVVEPGPYFREIRDAFETPETNRRQWPVYYLGLAIASALLFGLTAFVIHSGVALAYGITILALGSLCVADLLASG